MTPYGTLRVFIIIIHNERNVRRTLLTEYHLTEDQARRLFTAFQNDNPSLEQLKAEWQPSAVPLWE